MAGDGAAAIQAHQRIKLRPLHVAHGQARTHIGNAEPDALLAARTHGGQIAGWHFSQSAYRSQGNDGCYGAR